MEKTKEVNKYNPAAIGLHVSQIIQGEEDKEVLILTPKDLEAELYLTG